MKVGISAVSIDSIPILGHARMSLHTHIVFTHQVIAFSFVESYDVFIQQSLVLGIHAPHQALVDAMSVQCMALVLLVVFNGVDLSSGVDLG